MPDRFLGWWEPSKDPRRADVGMLILPGGVIEYRVHDPGGELTMRDEYKVLRTEGDSVYLALRRKTPKPSKYYYPYTKLRLDNSDHSHLLNQENNCSLTGEEFSLGKITGDIAQNTACSFGTVHYFQP